MATTLQPIRRAQALTPDRPTRPLPVPWRDPHSVSPAELKEYIGFLEEACAENPHSADLRTCLGVAYAMNFDVYKSMDTLEAAVALDEFSFPSGHTLHAVGFSVVALHYYPVLAPLLLPFTLMIALSRVVLGLHYPSDVLAATAIALGLGSVSLWIASGVF